MKPGGVLLYGCLADALMVQRLRRHMELRAAQKRQRDKSAWHRELRLERERINERARYRHRSPLYRNAAKGDE